MDIEYTEWCSFCMSNPAGGSLDIPKVGATLPVCDGCMEDYDVSVAPTIEEFLSNG